MRSVDRNTVKSIMTDRLSARSALTSPFPFCLAPGFVRLVRDTPTLLRELPSTTPTSRSPLVQKKQQRAMDLYRHRSFARMHSDGPHRPTLAKTHWIIILLRGGTHTRRQRVACPTPGEGSGKSVNKRKGRHFLKIGCEGTDWRGGLCYAALPLPTNKRNEWVTGRVNAVSRCPRSDGVHVLVHVQLPANRFQLALLLTP